MDKTEYEAWENRQAVYRLTRNGIMKPSECNRCLKEIDSREAMEKAGVSE